ncbi:hypothetical protein GCM10008995_28030 [Halobellus salinus]|uniref:DUF1643 domain-containing protein n=1 Tax=Halobellus salinus TaxID=931585 RepID=A0A830ETL4_9EURY|nr:DUF1643 domain-containing protein [Halobellus salinus]GGJ16543.1 hypothetical protein GCM10008995_28030 [Halobellus salinus]
MGRGTDRGVRAPQPQHRQPTADDPTVTRCGNRFTLRSSDPSDLNAHPAPVGPENDAHVAAAARAADRVVVGWGSAGGKRWRGRAVARRLGVDLHVVGTTKAGHPRHSSRTPYGTTIERCSHGDGG